MLGYSYLLARSVVTLRLTTKCSPAICEDLQARTEDGETLDNTGSIDLGTDTGVYISRVCKNGNSNCDFGAPSTARCTIYKQGDEDTGDSSKLWCIPIYRNKKIVSFYVRAKRAVTITDEYTIEITYDVAHGAQKEFCIGAGFQFHAKQTERCSSTGDPHNKIQRLINGGWNFKKQHHWGGGCNPETHSNTVCDLMPYGILSQTSETQVIAQFHHIGDRKVPTSHINHLVTTIKSLVVNFANIGYWTLVSRDVDDDGNPEQPEVHVVYKDDVEEHPFCMRETTNNKQGKTYWLVLPNGDQLHIKSHKSGNNGYVIDVKKIKFLGGSIGGVCSLSPDSAPFEPTSTYIASEPFQANPLVSPTSFWLDNGPIFPGSQCPNQYGRRYTHAGPTDIDEAEAAFDDAFSTATEPSSRRRSIESQWLVLSEEHTVARREDSAPQDAATCQAELDSLKGNVYLQAAVDANCAWDLVEDELAVFNNAMEDCILIGTYDSRASIIEQALSTCAATQQVGNSRRNAADDFVANTVANSPDLTCNDHGTPKADGVCDCHPGFSGVACRVGDGESVSITAGTLVFPNSNLAKAAQPRKNSYNLKKEKGKKNRRNTGSAGSVCVDLNELMRLTISGTDYGSGCSAISCTGYDTSGAMWRFVGDSTLEILTGTLGVPAGATGVQCNAVINGQSVEWGFDTC